MYEFDKLTIDQLKRVIEIRERIDSLQAELNELLGGEVAGTPPSELVQESGKKKRKMSAVSRKAIAAAQKARWAKYHAEKGGTKKVKSNGKMSTAGRSAISAAMKASWAKRKAAGKNGM